MIKATRSWAYSLGAIVALLLFTAPSALSASPQHPPIPARDIAGLNHACGAAVDSQGDVYASSAGESKIKVFNSAHALLASITNSNEPCGLAVDGKGRLYVSESKTGNVVRYTPNAYPLGNAPTYGSAEAVDSSGEAEGISVDPADDRLYVAEGDRVMVYQADGTTGQNERQNLLIPAAVTGGTFTIDFESQTTPPIAVNATQSKPTAAEIQSALEGLLTVGAGNVSVREGKRGERSFDLIFTHALGSQNVPAVSTDSSGLSNGAVLSGFSDEIPGLAFNGKIGEGDLGDSTGVASYTYDPDGTHQHYLFVGDSADNEVKVFTGANVDALVFKAAVDGKAVPDSAACPNCSEGFAFGVAGAAVSVDPATGHFFVYDGGHGVVDEFDASGRFLDQMSSPALVDAAPGGLAVLPERSSVQSLTIQAGGGTFSLGYEGAHTGPLAVGATATAVRGALEALPKIGAGNVSVREGWLRATGAKLYVVSFEGDLGARSVGEVSVDLSGVTEESVGTTVTKRLPGYGPGAVYVGSGAGSGAKLLAFGPLAPAGRSPLGEPLSHVLKKANAITTDSHGDVYVAADTFVHVYDPGGNELTKFEDPSHPGGLAVDSTGKIYVLDGLGSDDGEKLTYYTPDAYPPSGGSKYVRHEPPLLTKSSAGSLKACAVDPKNDHVFVLRDSDAVELDSAADGSAILSPAFGAGLSGVFISSDNYDIDVDGNSGDVYVSRGPVISVVNSTGTEVLAQIDGAGSPRGFLERSSIAVDQDNGHVLAFSNHLGAVQEYDATGGFVAEFAFPEPQGFSEELEVPRYGIAIDNSGGPGDGRAYIAFDDQKPNTADVWAFGALAYGEPPQAVTGVPSGLGAGDATLNGTVDPRGFSLEDCHFEFLDDASYQANLTAEDPVFQSAVIRECVPGIAAIGTGSKPVAVHADLSGLDPEGRYRFRLLAENKYGPSEGKAGLFGPPVLSPLESALPVLFDEATLRASVETAGLATKYHFEYGTGEDYGQSTPTLELAPGESPVPVHSALTGLAEGETYHFRAVVENEVKTVLGPDRVFTTQQRSSAATPPCPNTSFRTGLSSALPDCRAYELVTPAETRGALLSAPSTGSAGAGFNNWLTSPRGAGAGEVLTYGSTTTLPGFAGSGFEDSYRTERGDGAHPASGWETELVSPSFAQGGGGVEARNGSPDQLYSFWQVGPLFTLEDTLSAGLYLRTPSGFELAGRGSLGTDPNASPKFLGAGGGHVIFGSKAHLEEGAAPTGTEAIYDRAADSSSATVLTLRPDGAPFAAGEAATYVGANEDGTAVAFKVGGTLYLRHGGQTAEVTGSPSSFAGVSADGRRIFYAATSSGGSAASLYACDVEAGSCVQGPEPPGLTEIAPNAIFANVSEDGSHVLFTSESVLPGSAPNERGEEADASHHNLYLWDGSSIEFVAVLDPHDFQGFGIQLKIRLNAWTNSVTAGSDGGRADSPTRSTPDGGVFLFQSHARLTAYDNQGFGEIYRYDPVATGERLTCVSCDPGNAGPGADALLQTPGLPGPTQDKTLVANLADNGRQVFFQSLDRLLPGDANGAQDVYEWEANGSGGCSRPGGCLGLISSGQGERDNYLYSASADGHDVFFTTSEKLVGQDVAGSPSIYDARVDGGVPDQSASAPCQGDACQGNGSAPPALPTSSGAGDGNATGKGGSRCAKGRQRVKGRCVKRHHKVRGHKRRRAGHDRRAQR